MFFKKTGNMTQVPGAVMHLIEPTILPNTHKSPQVGTHSFEDISLLWTLLLSRAILFYFTQNYTCKT